MGNRGNIVFVSGDTISPTIYLHWNGGPESVYRFLAELDRREVRADGEYEAARFVQIVGEFFDHSPWDFGSKDSTGRGEGLSLGILAGPTAITAEALADVPTDNSDNGFYVVNRIENRVRRFVVDYEAGERLAAEAGLPWARSPIRELTAAEVRHERDAAASETAYDGIDAVFEELAEYRKANALREHAAV